RTAHPARRQEHVGRTVVADAVAALGHVAVARGDTADRRALQIRGAVRARAGAPFVPVAVARRRTADRGGGEKGSGRAVVADAVTALGDVADPRRGPTDRFALVVRGTARARPRAALREIADAGCRAADNGRRREHVGRTI